MEELAEERGAREQGVGVPGPRAKVGQQAGDLDGGLPAGLAEFTNEGEFIRRLELPADAPYMYDVAVKPDLNRMVTSSFTPLNNYKKPLAQMDLKNFGKEHPEFNKLIGDKDFLNLVQNTSFLQLVANDQFQRLAAIPDAQKAISQATGE